MSKDWGRYSDVDHAEDPTFFVEMLEAQDRLPGTSRARAVGLEMLAPAPGMRIVDAGCGIGTAAREIAARVRPGGSVVGIDLSERMLDIARARVGDEVEFQLGDLTALAFDDASFDAARTERVLQHLADPVRAFGELARVVRPGGRVVAVDTDWDSFVVDVPDDDLAEKLRVASCRRVASPRIGRRLYGIAKRAGLADVRVEAVPVLTLDAVMPGTDLRPGAITVQHAMDEGILSSEEGARALAAMAQAEEQGTFLVSFMMYAVGGTVV